MPKGKTVRGWHDVPRDGTRTKRAKRATRNRKQERALIRAQKGR